MLDKFHKKINFEGNVKLNLGMRLVVQTLKCVLFEIEINFFYNSFLYLFIHHIFCLGKH